jgi:hypothetical protein
MPGRKVPSGEKLRHSPQPRIRSGDIPLASNPGFLRDRNVATPYFETPESGAATFLSPATPDFFATGMSRLLIASRNPPGGFFSSLKTEN